MNPVSLYLHLPYCQAKCPYCDFNSYAARRWPEARYAGALEAELAHYAERTPWSGATVQTVFFGGGTPSLFAPASIGALLNTVARHWRLADAIEVTLEANPGTVGRERLAGFRAAGVNRMSFGVQSFTPHHLRTLGRIHDADQARAAVALARAVGFTNISVDLIFALPEQTPAEWERDLREALALQPEHLSAYNLTYEEGTPFHRWRTEGRLRPLPEEIEVAMFTRTQEVLGAAGFTQYEISNYARAGRACRHNLTYWQNGAYLGVGAGAHSYAPGDGSWGTRWANIKDPNAYMRAVQQRGEARCTSETLDARQARGEFVFLGLRCRRGFPAAQFRARFGAEFPELFTHVGDLRAGGLLECAEEHWRLTPAGLLLADSVFATFL